MTLQNYLVADMEAGFSEEEIYRKGFAEWWDNVPKSDENGNIICPKCGQAGFMNIRVYPYQKSPVLCCLACLSQFIMPKVHVHNR